MKALTLAYASVVTAVLNGSIVRRESVASSCASAAAHVANNEEHEGV
jgi:hypothetical protein